MTKESNIILGVTGSIAAYRSADLTRGLIEKGLKVSVVMTKSAERFITPLTLSALSGQRVYRSLWDSQNDVSKMDHIELANQADVLLIAPATADIIGRIAAGFADDLLTCVAMGTQAPILIAPAMNTNMYQNPIVQQNIKKLQDIGIKFVTPVEGKLACGVTGDGHIADEQTIIEAVMQELQ